MGEMQTYTLEEAHRHFGKALNDKVWELLNKPERNRAENEMMVYASYASLYHWLQVGTAVHHQRGEWLIARVFTEIDVAGSALRHAERCLELTKEFAAEIKDFDRAYAFEGLSRAHALAGNAQEAGKFRRLAGEAGQVIADPEGNRIFLADFNSGDSQGPR